MDRSRRCSVSLILPAPIAPFKSCLFGFFLRIDNIIEQHQYKYPKQQCDKTNAPIDNTTSYPSDRPCLNAQPL
jgi:hypothetical protein